MLADAISVASTRVPVRTATPLASSCRVIASHPRDRATLRAAATLETTRQWWPSGLTLRCRVDLNQATVDLDPVDQRDISSSDARPRAVPLTIPATPARSADAPLSSAHHRGASNQTIPRRLKRIRTHVPSPPPSSAIASLLSRTPLSRRHRSLPSPEPKRVREPSR